MTTTTTDQSAPAETCAGRAGAWFKRLLFAIALFVALSFVPIILASQSAEVSSVIGGTIGVASLIAAFLILRPIRDSVFGSRIPNAIICMGLILAMIGTIDRVRGSFLEEVTADVAAGETERYGELLDQAREIDSGEFGPAWRGARALMDPAAHLDWLKATYGDTDEYLQLVAQELPDQVQGEEERVRPLIREAEIDEARRKRLEAREEQQATNREKAEEKRKGFHCLSSWDGRHTALADAVKETLREPDSFEHIETYITPVDGQGQHNVRMVYRARNGFGGMNVEEIGAVIAHYGCEVLEVRG